LRTSFIAKYGRKAQHVTVKHIHQQAYSRRQLWANAWLAAKRSKSSS
jgi:hypothetical protein